MSAFEVLPVHIDVLVSASLQFQTRGTPFSWDDEPMPVFEEGYQQGRPWGNLAGFTEWRDMHRHELRPTASQKDLDRVGRMLRAANQDSLNFRYAEERVEDDYTFTRIHELDPIKVLGAIACYEYQTCEPPSYPGSEAKQFIERLRQLIVNYLIAVNEAPWAISHKHEAQVGTEARDARYGRT